MTALEAFRNRHGLIAGALLAGVVGVGAVVAAPPAAQPIPVHSVADDVVGHRLVDAAGVRIADQFDDMKRLVSVIDNVADLPISGADKMRAVTTAYNGMARITPDGGAAIHDARLFQTAGLTSGVDFKVAVRELNEDKLDLARATLSLRKIQDALLVGDEGKLAENLAAMESSVVKFDTRHKTAQPAGIVGDNVSPLVASMEVVKTYVNIERPKTEVEINRPRVYVQP